MVLELIIYLFIICFFSLSNVNFFYNKFFYSKFNVILTLSSIFLFLFFFSLIYSFCIYDSSIATIFLTSNLYIPLGYKIGAFWSTHDGSIILWNVVLWMFLLSYPFMLNGHLKIKFFRFFNFKSFMLYGIILFFLYFIFFSNVFVKVNFYLMTKKLLTLNPILQDISLLFHPICLYLGYIGLIMPCIVLYSYNYSHLNNHYIFGLYNYYSFFVLWILTIGLFLGSWWAYYEIGWGGWWFWDPVENVALIPWCIIIILVHLMMMYKKKFYFKKLLFFLVAFNFFFSIIGTFLIRSGMFNSVHSFAELANENNYIFVIVFFLFSYIVYALYSKPRQAAYNQSFSPNNVFGWMIVCMLLTLFVIFFGTFLPIFFGWLANISVGSHFYESLIILFIIPLSLFMLYFLNLRYKVVNLYKEFIFGIGALWLWYPFLPANYYNLVLFSCLVVIGLNALVKGDLFMKVSHIVFGFFTIVVILNSIGEQSMLYYLVPGDRYVFCNLVIYYTDLFRSLTLDHFSVVSEFIVLDPGKTIYSFFFPEQRFFSTKVFTFKSSINCRIMDDFSIFLTKTEEEDSWAMRFKYSPYINLIWLGFIIMIINIGYKFIKPNHKIFSWR